MHAVAEAVETLRESGTLELAEGRIRYHGQSGEAVQSAIETLRRNRDAALRLLRAESNPSEIPPADVWPESLRDLAEERAAVSGDFETARREVWISYYEWKARALNRLFWEQGLTGEPGRIAAETVRDGERSRGNDCAPMRTSRKN